MGKNILGSLMILSIILTALRPMPVVAESLSERLLGTILLQVEGHGEAWYVNPTDGHRYYMKDGPTAYQMMREFGLGISEEDFANIETDEEMNDRLRGQIVLRVNLHGEAYYIHPDDGSVNYLQNGDAAYSVMRFLSLGITNADLALIETAELEMPTVALVLGDTEETEPVVIVDAVEEEPEVIIIREIVREPTIIYVEAPQEVEEEPVGEVEPITVPLAIEAWGNSNWSTGALVEEGSAYGVNSMPGSRHTLAIQPAAWSGHQPQLSLSIDVGNPQIGPDTNLSPGFSCEKSGASFWSGGLDPLDQNQNPDLSTWVADFWVNYWSNYSEGSIWTESKELTVTCTADDGGVFTDSLTLILTSKLF